MNAALLLIDLQHDFLSTPHLQPSAGQVTDRAAALVAACRQRHVPIYHIYTTVSRDPDNRMPHWKSTNRWMCEPGTPGHAAPDSLKPVQNDTVLHKQFFSAFSCREIFPSLQAGKIDTLILAGIHLHACIRATALDAYQLGLSVLIADDAVASDDPLHAAITRRYLRERAIRFADVQTLSATFDLHPSVLPVNSSAYEHLSPTTQRPLWQMPLSSPEQIAQSAANLHDAWLRRPQTSLDSRAAACRALAKLLRDQERELALQIATDVGKPITLARAEVERSAQLLHACADCAQATQNHQTQPRCRRVALGTIAVITPWNNPLAIPVGKIAAALLYDNAVLWKPALPATQIAHRLLELWRRTDPGAPLEMISGGSEAARLAAQNPHIDALTLSGSLHAGYALNEIAARRHIPFQAELGGNNSAIVAQDADLAHAAREIAAGAFFFAGQRCTANRRAIVVGNSSRISTFLEATVAATREIPLGDPLHESTRIGPLISPAKREEPTALLRRVRDSGFQIITPHEIPLPHQGAFFPPAIVIAPDPEHEIVQEESFGPILVIQPATTFDQALELANSVRQGLVAACFTHNPDLQQQFLRTARAGILKLNQSTSDADASSPFGGWKASGIGPPEHGPADLEFFTRAQTIYMVP